MPTLQKRRRVLLILIGFMGHSRGFGNNLLLKFFPKTVHCHVSKVRNQAIKNA